MRIVVCYDISDTKRRNEVAKILEGHGYRVQYSVFECDLKKEQLERLQQRLRPLVKGQEWAESTPLGESIRFYSLCADCVKKVTVVGKDLARSLGPVEQVEKRPG